MTGKLVVAGLLALLALPACGSSDDTEKAKQQCEDLITRFCTSVTTCQVSGGVLKSSEQAAATATCKSEFKQELDCSKAQGVGSTYDACMTKLGNPPCADVNQAIVDGTLELPSECKQVILVSS